MSRADDGAEAEIWHTLRVERLEDKSDWGPGPWEDEPDLVEWRHRGLPCLIVRSDVTGGLCGYVGVPRGHLYYRQDYDAVPAEVHGGLTYCGPCDSWRRELRPLDREKWWFGFDSAHCFDFSPKMDAQLRRVMGPEYRDKRQPWPGGGEWADKWCEKYRTIGYVRLEVEALAIQLASMPRVRISRRREHKHEARRAKSARKQLVELAGLANRTGMDGAFRRVSASVVLRKFFSRGPVTLGPSVPLSLRRFFVGAAEVADVTDETAGAAADAGEDGAVRSDL